MAEQVNFRSAFRGFNRTDVVRHLEFLHNSHEYKLNQLHTEIEELHTEIEELRAELTLARQLPSRSAKLDAELEATKARCAELEEMLEAAQAGIILPEPDDSDDRCAELETQLAAVQQRLADAEIALSAAKDRAADAEATSAAAQQRIDELGCASADEQPGFAAMDARLEVEKQRNAELEAALAASAQRIAELESLLGTAQLRNNDLKAQLEQNQSKAQPAEAVAAPVVTPDLEAQELAAYRRAERVERMAHARARDIALQANGVLHDATARVDEDAVELSELFEALGAQLDRLRDRMIASKSTLHDAATAMRAISADEDEN